MAINIQELDYRPNAEIMTASPKPEFFGAIAFDAAMLNTMLHAKQGEQGAILDSRLATATIDAARAYAAQIDPNTFIEAHKKLRRNGLPVIQRVLGDENEVLGILDDDEHQGVTADFVIELASIGEKKDEILSTVSEITADAPDEALVNFRELLLEPDADRQAPESKVEQTEAPITLSEIVKSVFDEVAVFGEGAISAQRVISTFPELRTDITKLNRNRGKGGKMIIDPQDLIELLVTKRGKALNETLKTIKQSIKAETRERQETREKGGE